MLSRRRLPAVLLSAMVVSAVFAPAASAAPKTVIFNMYPSPLTQPVRVFFQANSGPFLDKLVWSDWGADTATGTGTWRLDCSNGGGGCAPGDPSLEYPARYVLSNLGPCPRFGKTAQSYRDGVVTVDRPDGAHVIPFDSDYDFCAKPPTKKTAAAAVRRFVARRYHGHRITVTCTIFKSDVYADCHARWTRAGRKRKREFEVNRGMTGPIGVTPLGS